MEAVLLIQSKPHSVAAITPYTQSVHIYTLGRFAVVITGKLLHFSTKAPKKPLELLKVVIALGGRSVDIDDIMSTVWPAQGRAARASFDVALMRLRKLLGQPASLLLCEGKLTLNEAVCWVDVWTLERAIAQIASESGNADRAMFDLYRGRFLNSDGDAPWIASLRDRLAAKFRRALLTLARMEEQRCNWNEAAQLYRRGLEHENLAEELYYRLMHCEWRLGRRAEIINTYRRCCDLLQLKLSATPSSELRALYRRVLADQHTAMTSAAPVSAIG